jgi:hypothetical protein
MPPQNGEKQAIFLLLTTPDFATRVPFFVKGRFFAHQGTFWEGGMLSNQAWER